MSCRHDLACGTCKRCYPKTGTIEPAPEDEYEDNLEGLGAITKEEYLKTPPKGIGSTLEVEVVERQPEQPSTRTKPLVLIESPYRNGDRDLNLRFLSWCEFDSYMRGEHPIASHGNCTAYLPEDEESRVDGFAWRERVCSIVDRVAYYTNLGISPGMQIAMDNDQNNGKTVKRRELGPQLMWHFNRGEYAPGSMRRSSSGPLTEYLGGSIMGVLGVRGNRRRVLSNGWARYVVCDVNGPIGNVMFHHESSTKDILVNLVTNRFGDYIPDLLSGEVKKSGNEFLVSRQGETVLKLRKI